MSTAWPNRDHCTGYTFLTEIFYSAFMPKHSLICQLDKYLWVNLLMVPMTCLQDMLIPQRFLVPMRQTLLLPTAWGWLHTRIMKAKRSLISILTFQKMIAFPLTILCSRKEKSGYKHIQIPWDIRVRHPWPLSCCSIQDRISHTASIKLLKGWPNFLFFSAGRKGYREKHVKMWSVRNVAFGWKE